MRVTFKSLIAALACTMLLVQPTVAEAQFRNLLRDGAKAATKKETCASGKKSSVGSRVLGGVLGGVTRRTQRKVRVPTFVPVPQYSTTINEAIACKLQPEEQKQAAEATIAATRGAEDGERPEIGASAVWESETREKVSGSSTVTGREELTDDADCILVTDVVIIDGEETRAEKRMCRPPGSARYSIVA